MFSGVCVAFDRVSFNPCSSSPHRAVTGKETQRVDDSEHGRRCSPRRRLAGPLQAFARVMVPDARLRPHPRVFPGRQGPVPMSPRQHSLLQCPQPQVRGAAGGGRLVQARPWPPGPPASPQPTPTHSERPMVSQEAGGSARRRARLQRGPHSWGQHRTESLLTPSFQVEGVA